MGDAEPSIEKNDTHCTLAPHSAEIQQLAGSCDYGHNAEVDLEKVMRFFENTTVANWIEGRSKSSVRDRKTLIYSKSIYHQYVSTRVVCTCSCSLH